MQRPFTSGSRQAPDPFDQFLEENHFYRKHTARDSSCLFRTISEQMYDTQLHHLTIRRKCVNFMRKHHSYFQSQVDGDLDEYLDDMSKPKTYGSLVELQAAAFVFKWNVFLFEPYNLGKYFIYRSHFTNVLRVFYTPERHFDSVFTSDYIKNVAICQSICYEILYKDLFKLPDVTFAVEQMLHSTTLETTQYRTECNEEGYCTRIYMEDGRTFNFDLPESTYCILENYRLCHFHNPNFPRFSEELQRDLKCAKNEDSAHKCLSKTVDSLLSDKYISCVRQLLLEGITPFPYKVAKALDPNMYRNIEFDSWNEARKELKFGNWYNGDSNFKLKKYQKTRVRRIFQVGAKCHVKLFKSETDLYTCHIQEMSVEKGYCIVFVEQLGEKRLVPCDSLKPLPPDQFKPWTLPYRLQRHIQKCNSYRYARQCNYRLKVDEQFTSQDFASLGYFDENDPKQQNIIYKLKQFTHLENFRTHTMEYCTMPLTVEHARDNHDNKSQRNDSSRGGSRCSDVQKSDFVENNGGTSEVTGGEPEISPERQYVYPASGYADEYYSYGYDPSIIHAGPQAIASNNGAPLYYVCNATSYQQSSGMYMQAPPPTQVIATPQNTAGFYPQYYQLPPSAGSGSYNVTPSILRRGNSTTPLTGRINFDVKKSLKANGSDLPGDVPTLRYFYNLGLEYHQKLYPNVNTDGAIDSKEGIVKVSPDCQVAKIDENGNNVDTKPDANNNSQNNYKSNNNNNNNNNQRRFSSRYFNNKERSNYRSAQQNNRYQQNDYNNAGGKGQKQNHANHQAQHSGPNSTPNSRNMPSGGNNQRPGSANPLTVNEFTVQNSPMITIGNPENGESMQTPNGYNSTGQIVDPYVGTYVQEFEQAPPQSTGVFMPMQVGPTPYGIYAAPPSIGAGPVSMHSTAGFPYMTAPPPTAVPMHSPAHAGPPQGPMTQAYYAPAGVESAGATVIEGSMDPNQFACMGYPPPMQVYYSPSGGVSAPTVQPGGTPGMGAQGYWCIPPPIQPHPSPQPQAVTMMAPNHQPTIHRRDNQPKPHRSSTGEQ